MPKRPIELSDSEANFDRFSAAQSPKLVVARVDTSSEEEVDMALNPRRGLRDLVAVKSTHIRYFSFFFSPPQYGLVIQGKKLP